ncbi:MAG: SpoIIIAC/SpoIIIAD family protein [Fusicatenibacter sp.]|nr:stage III sporulation protein AD [Fusicatenibacter sp.]
MDVIRIALLGAAGTVLCILLKGTRPEYALYVTFGTGIFILTYSVGKLDYLIGMLRKVREYLPLDSTYLNTLLKMIGITYVGQFSSAICKDAGCSSIAGQIEIFSKLSILAVSMPILLALMETIHGFLS